MRLPVLNAYFYHNELTNVLLIQPVREVEWPWKYFNKLEKQSRVCYNMNLTLQANLIITLSLGSIETDRVISESCYNEVSFYRHIVK